MKGKVIFVGAGSGSADLLTLRAVRCLERADVVLHDDLVARDVLDLVSPTAAVHNVGKRCGRAGISQAALNGLMIEHARRGRNVVRLKSGDPGMFGRLGEEMDALQEAGIAFEIVPGVTAALAAAAAARITLTDRRSASRVVFAAASLAGGKRQDWAKIASPDTTLVIYMPGRDFAALGEELLEAGVAPGLPCSVISNAGGVDENASTGTVLSLAGLRRVAAPAVVIIGPQVRSKGQSELRAGASRAQEKVPPQIEVGH